MGRSFVVVMEDSVELEEAEGREIVVFYMEKMVYGNEYRIVILWTGDARANSRHLVKDLITISAVCATTIIDDGLVQEERSSSHQRPAYVSLHVVHCRDRKERVLWRESSFRLLPAPSDKSSNNSGSTEIPVNLQPYYVVISLITC